MPTPVVNLKDLEVWFVTGAQPLYGEAALAEVAQHSREIAEGLSGSPATPVRVVAQPVMTTSDAIRNLCLDANRASNCVGLVLWMHTFSPAQEWIAGLQALRKPFVHLHTQYHRELPWSSINMDFMNLNQSAHGDREFGFITSRLRLNRKVIAGFWRDKEVQNELGDWVRAACAWRDMQTLRVARLGDNMRQVAVTEGDKVAARIRLGYSVEGYGVGDLVERVKAVKEQEVQALIAEYEAAYTLAPPLRAGGAKRSSLEDAARIEAGLRRFLKEGGFYAFTDTFQDLHGLSQLPGVAVQRLMAEGYGFGAEGDWKTAALVRAMKVMSSGLDGGTSFMEDYTYHLKDGGEVLGAHMLEVCPSIAADRPSLEIHPLAIGGKDDPVRLVFTSRSGPAIVASLIDVGDRFRLLANNVNAIPPDEPLPNLPVARAIWVPEPDLKVASSSWILAGGAHHTGFSLALTERHLEDFAEMAGIEFLLIGKGTTISDFKREVKWNEAYYRLARL